MIKRIISGGQCGADMAGLFVGRLLDIETGGWAPKGWYTEDGPQPELLKSYGLMECQSAGYPFRTSMNVLDSSGTVIFGGRSPGSNATEEFCRLNKKPMLWVTAKRVLDGPDEEVVKVFLDWLKYNRIEVMNVAGNRESKCPGIGAGVVGFLVEALGRIDGL